MVLTDSQTRIVDAALTDILVSAAAGSGKTTVLTERIASRIIAGQLDIERVLVVTFTDAAARNMRRKIEKRLRQALTEADDQKTRQTIARQLALLSGAAISTIHSFCLQVITNFHHLTITEDGQPLAEPGYAVLEENEAGTLLAEELDKLFNAVYESIDRESFLPWLSEVGSIDDFYKLVDGYGGSKNDQALRALVLDVYRYLRSLPDYERQMAYYLETLEATAQDFSSSVYCRSIFKQLRLRLDRALTVLCDLESQLEQSVRFVVDNRRNQEINDQFKDVASLLRELDRGLKAETLSWDDILTFSDRLQTLSVPATRQTDAPEKTIFLDLFIQHVAEAICFISGKCCTLKYSEHFLFATTRMFDRTQAQIEAEIETMLPALSIFLRLVGEVDRRYQARKRQLSVLDFSDFEHLALVILSQPEARRYYSQRFKEIYVDEYQDTSSIQETILASISRQNRLMVGDIKQSIYRFRHARPEIFLAKSRAFAAGSGGNLMELHENFRSVPRVLAAVNDVFAQLMSVGAGEVNYDRHQALASVRPDDPSVETAVEVLLLGPGQAEADENVQNEDLTAREREARAVCQRILELRQSGLPWTDIAVLGRTRQIVNDCCQQARLMDIPVSAQSERSVMDTPLFMQLEAMLHCLDNMAQDIPLAAVLNGPICGEPLSLDEMTGIRLYAIREKYEFFHQAVFNYPRTGPDSSLRDKLSRILDWLSQLRLREQYVSLGELLEQIYTERGWLERIARQADGGEQVRVLRQFQIWCERFERFKLKGLYRLARYLEDMRRLKLTDESIEPAGSSDNAVQIMTVHASKGLEFPVVFLLGLSRKLNGPSGDASIILSENYGLGFDFVDRTGSIRYPSLVKRAMLDELAAAVMAEEMRLFYVAMTRAMERLFLVGSYALDGQGTNKRLIRLVENARRHTLRQLPDYLVRSARTGLEWLIMALARNKTLDLGFLDQLAEPAKSGVPVSEELAGTPAFKTPFTGWQIRLSGSDMTPIDLKQELEPQAEPDQESAGVVEQVAAAPSFLRARVIEPYRFQAAARLPLKLTVSELKRQEAASSDDETKEVRWNTSRPPLRSVDQVMIVPEEEDQMKPEAIGSALHTAIQYLDFTKALKDGPESGLEQQLKRMESKKILSRQQREAVERFKNQLWQLVRSDLAAEFIAAQESDPAAAQRETPFTLLAAASEIYPQEALGVQDQVMIQGMIDLWYRTDRGLVLVDFKSDNLSGSPDEVAEKLRRRYSAQLRWYARALKEATGQAVVKRLIWHIRSARAIEV